MQCLNGVVGSDAIYQNYKVSLKKRLNCPEVEKILIRNNSLFLHGTKLKTICKS